MIVFIFIFDFFDINDQIESAGPGTKITRHADSYQDFFIFSIHPSSAD